MKLHILVLIFFAGSSLGKLFSTDSSSDLSPRAAIPQPANSSFTCKGGFFSYCHGGDANIAKNAVSGWQSFVFYEQGTSIVASNSNSGRTTYFGCQNEYAGPLLGMQLKEGFQFLLDKCSNACRKSVQPSYPYEELSDHC